jgi:circadian clock protein KaiC
MTVSTPPQRLARLPSGVAGLDTVLHGGFLAGDSYMIAGQPGTGKTTLSNQLCFTHVAAGGRAVYVSLLTETHDRLFLHLEGFTFFTREPIGDRLYYVSGMNSLVEGGWRGLLEFLRRVVREQQATLLIVDGLAFDMVAETDLSFAQFVQRLQAHMAAHGCTTFLVTHLPADTSLAPVHTMTDGVIEMMNQRQQLRALREIEIRKLRGSAYLEGRHQMAIHDHGVVVYPRTEQVYKYPVPSPDEPTDRMSWGIQELDTMSKGGLISGSTTLVLGPSGSGKTIVGLHFLAAGAQRGEPSLYVGFFESPPRLLRKAANLGLPLDAAVEAKQFHMVWQPPLEASIDAVAERLFATIEQHGVRRLFIDGLNGLQQSADYGERLPRFLAALSQELRARNVTTLMSTELETMFGPTVHITLPGVSAISENLLFLRYVELRSQLYRLLSIIKMRESEHDASIREFAITNEGIKVDATFATAEAILTGVAHPSQAAEGPPPLQQRLSSKQSRAADAT